MVIPWIDRLPRKPYALLAHGRNLVVGPFQPGADLLFCPSWLPTTYRLGADPMDFPILDLMDQEACRQKLFDLLHPEGFACPRCGAREGLNVHRRHPDSPVVDYRCKGCRRVFNMFTGTPWQGTHLSPRPDPLDPPRHRPRGPHREARPRGGDQPPAPVAAAARDPGPGAATPPTTRRCRTTRPRPTRCTRTRGKKGVPHTDPDDPPRRRANQAKGHGTWETDRPPVPGVVGRASGRVWFRVGRRSSSAELVDATVLPATVAGGDGVHRRVERVQPAGPSRPGARDGQP